MARAKVEDKEKAILEAAVGVFAERGYWNTPTSLISRTAGVADGTLFTYFKTKDELISQVYLDIKRELAEETLDGLSDYQTVHDKMRHIWNGYIEWGIRHPERFKVLHQIEESFALDEAVRAQGMEPWIEIDQMVVESIQNGLFRGYPVNYLAQLIGSQAVMTIQFITANDADGIDYKQIGFDILWNGITRGTG